MAAPFLRYPAVRPSGPARRSSFAGFSDPRTEVMPQLAKLLQERHSTRSFDDGQPITLAELSRFLDAAARILPQLSGEQFSARRPRGKPSALSIGRRQLRAGALSGGEHLRRASARLLSLRCCRSCAGPDRASPAKEVKALLKGAADAMGATAAPQVLITIAARFARVSWKYSSIAYSLILKNVGVLNTNVLLDGHRNGTWRLRSWDREYQPVCEDDEHRIPCRGPGRSICHRSRR